MGKKDGPNDPPGLSDMKLQGYFAKKLGFPRVAPTVHLGYRYTKEQIADYLEGYDEQH